MARAVIQILIETLLFLSYPFIGLLSSFFNRNATIPLPENGKTILIVERWLNKNPFHLIWKRHLESQGFQVHLSFYPIQTGTFSQSASALKQYIESKKLTDITLVGISSGGLTALLYLQEQDGWKHVNTFISIGTPFNGTLAALPLSINKSCRELLPWSKLSRTLKASRPTHANKIFCLFAAFDELVPRSSTSLPGANTVRIPSYGHNVLHLISKETYSTVARLAHSGTVKKEA